MNASKTETATALQLQPLETAPIQKQSIRTEPIRTQAARIPNTRVMRIAPWFLFAVFEMLAVLGYAVDQSKLSFLFGGFGFVIFSALRRLNAPQTLKLRFEDRQAFTVKLVSIMERLGFKCSATQDTGLDFGPKMALRQKLIGNKVILVDFVEPTLAVVSGPKGFLTQLEKKLEEANNRYT